MQSTLDVSVTVIVMVYKHASPESYAKVSCMLGSFLKVRLLEEPRKDVELIGIELD